MDKDHSSGASTPDSNSDSTIRNVSDTALWVAVYRALETQRPDALFQDRFATVLAGERGKKIAKAMALSKIMAWVMTIRTVAIDRLILQAIEEGVDAVINLGAGLDTRPYRLKLPSSLQWFEIDLPELLQYKESKLRQEAPVCHLERIPVDLFNINLRHEVFSKVASQSKKTLIISEGLIPYLPNEQVADLAKDLAKFPTFHFWIQDYYTTTINYTTPRRWKKRLKTAPWKFHVNSWFEFFSQHGWQVHQTITIFDEAERVRRPFPYTFLTKMMSFLVPLQKRLEFRKKAGYVLLENRK